MTDLAKEHGLSDNGFRKKCKKYNIPMPNAGYWAKKKFGKEGPRPPLPAYEGSTTIEIRNESLSQFDIVQKESPEPEEVQKQIEFEALPENHIQVLATLSTPHPLITQFKAAIREQRAFSSNRYGIIPVSSAYLDLRVTQGALDRALRIVNALIKAAERRGMAVSIVKEQSHYSNSTRQFTAAVVLGENVEFCIKETVQQKKKEVLSDKKKPAYSWQPTEYEHIPTGILTLSIKESTFGHHRLNWNDGTRQNIENCLNDFMVALVRTSVCKRNDRLKREQRERERINQQIRQHEEQKRREEEAARLKVLVQEVTNWQTSILIRSYVEAVKVAESQKAGAGESDSGLHRWVTWALEQADKLDPIRSNIA
jgi:hypothetical protein